MDELGISYDNGGGQEELLQGLYLGSYTIGARPERLPKTKHIEFFSFLDNDEMER